MAGTPAIIRFHVNTDSPPASIVKVVGSIPELGNWGLEGAPALKFEAGTGLFVASIPLPISGWVDFEYKVAVKRPVDDRPVIDSVDGWEWQPGPNRRFVAAARASTSAPSLSARGPLVTETWYHAMDGTLLIDTDPYLEPHREHLKRRYAAFTEALATIEALEGGMDAFSRGYEHFGLNRGVQDDGKPGWWYREWAPGAAGISLIGDFNGWDDAKHVCTRDDFGVWTCFVPDEGGGIPHDTFVKARVTLSDGSKVTRLPAWIRYAVYDPKLNEYCGKVWNPPADARHVWKHARPVSLVAASDYCKVPGILPLSHGSVDDAEVATGGSGGASSTAPTLHRRGMTGMAGVKVSQRASAFARPGPAPGARFEVDVASDPARCGLKVYEAHVGMGSREGKVASYREFAAEVLPRVKALGYNCVQLMAIMEHAYYGSFGYHVTSFMASSSRYGTPEDLKHLVDVAHGMGLLVIMDLVHSHAAKNVNDGLNLWDGTEYHYFHAGERGSHALWDSRLFDYSKLEVQRFLLSSARLFVEEFRFDGYRFDGVTSMMYHHHGLSYGFSGGYHEYFGDHTDLSAVVYLMLANHMLHTCTPPALTIAEDVSGMPGLCRPVWEGGVGFDYRLAMAIPDKWIKVLKEVKDEEWNMGDLVFTLTNRRWQEKTIAYAESHDQALVGDKTLAFWLMDKEMYFHMSTLEKPVHPVIDRGMALHKMIRLLTFGLGGEGYLNFMGNEFGHPEWIDFPREGNGWSYHHCRRQWNLVDDDLLHYKHLNAFDGAMHRLEAEFPWLVSHRSFVSLKHEADKMVVFDHDTVGGHLVFVFNFHPSSSYTGYRIGVPVAGEWAMALDSDWGAFGGYNRVTATGCWHADTSPWNDRPASMQVYSPCRSVQVYARKK